MTALRGLPPSLGPGLSTEEAAAIDVERDRIARIRAQRQDAVVFTAPCPACGGAALWLETREDTQTRINVSCACAWVARDAKPLRRSA